MRGHDDAPVGGSVEDGWSMTSLASEACTDKPGVVVNVGVGVGCGKVVDSTTATKAEENHNS